MNIDNTASALAPRFIEEVKQIVRQARQKAYSAINTTMVEAYWQLGKRIVEQEQVGKERADYGKQLLKTLSKELTMNFGKEFSTNTLYYYRQFYLMFPEIFPTAWGILTWSHYKRLISVTNPDAREWYLKEAAECFHMGERFLKHGHTDGEEKESYDKLCKAYIEARYNLHFTVSEEQFEYMLTRTEILREVTTRECAARMAYYEEMAQKEEQEKTNDH